MRKLVALVVAMAFALGVGLAVPQTFAQAPAPKDEKKGEMMDKKDEKKTKCGQEEGREEEVEQEDGQEGRQEGREEVAPPTPGAPPIRGGALSGASGSRSPCRWWAGAAPRETRLPAGLAVIHVLRSFMAISTVSSGLTATRILQ